MKPTAAAVITKKRTASRLRTLAPIKRSPGRSLVLVPEAVSDAAHGEEVFRGSRSPLELLAEMADVDVHGPRISVGGVAPDLLEQHLARLHPPRRSRQRGEDLELDVGELGPLAPDRHHAPLEVDLQPSRRDGLLAAGPAADHLRTPQRRPDPAAELPDRERFGDVVVGPHLEAEHLVD